MGFRKQTKRFLERIKPCHVVPRADSSCNASRHDWSRLHPILRNKKREEQWKTVFQTSSHHAKERERGREKGPRETERRGQPASQPVAPQWMDTVTFCGTPVATAFQTFPTTWKSLGKTRPIPPVARLQSFLSAAQLWRQLSEEEAATILWLLFSRLSNAPGAPAGRDRCGERFIGASRSRRNEIRKKGGMTGADLSGGW